MDAAILRFYPSLLLQQRLSSFDLVSSCGSSPLVMATTDGHTGIKLLSSGMHRLIKSRSTGRSLTPIDGGGIRGLSELLILKYLMEAVDPTHPPKPCEFFDVIGGTSTGG